MNHSITEDTGDYLHGGEALTLNRIFAAREMKPLLN